MGCLGVDYCAPLDVCVVRITGDVTEDEVVGVLTEALARQPGSSIVWDVSAADFARWGFAAVAGLVSHVRTAAELTPGRRAAIVVESPVGFEFCRALRDLIEEQRVPVQVALFPNRSLALEWLDVLHVPIGV
ncbi:MAG: hypothetical protein JW751_25240 [Polyangiaceae bacterium]|nr:hypothetical protein [Polyangiaceae bacterium]